MGGFLQGLASTVGTLADAAGAQPSAKQQEKRQDEVLLRERQADGLENTITALQADTTLSAQEKAFRIGEARKQLTGLYQPHEGPDLLKQIGRVLRTHKG